MDLLEGENKTLISSILTHTSHSEIFLPEGKYLLVF